MSLGKTLFAQLMEFVSWTSFARIVARHGGDSGVRNNLSCAEQFRAMGFRAPPSNVRHWPTQRSAQLAHLGRFGDIADLEYTQTVCNATYCRLLKISAPTLISVVSQVWV
jgi:hypothetical protein